MTFTVKVEPLAWVKVGGSNRNAPRGLPWGQSEPCSGPVLPGRPALLGWCGPAGVCGAESRRRLVPGRLLELQQRARRGGGLFRSQVNRIGRAHIEHLGAAQNDISGPRMMCRHDHEDDLFLLIVRCWFARRGI